MLLTGVEGFVDMLRRLSGQPARDCGILGIISDSRIHVVDAVRGFAIFGILVVNVGSYFYPSETPHPFLVAFLFEGKFHPILAFLFGFGLFRQLSRGPRYAFRRSAVLAAFGLAHGFLLWPGDILVLYACTAAVVTVFFRAASPRTLLAWAATLLACPVIGVGLLVPFSELAKEEFAKAVAESRRDEQAQQILATRAYSSGSYIEVTRRRVVAYSDRLRSMVWGLSPSVLAMFLLGLRAGRLGWFDGDTRHFRRRLFYAAPIGLMTSAYAASNALTLSRLETIDWGVFFQVAADSAASVFLSQAYIAAVVLFGERLRLLRAVGRTALTNYLCQSLVMTTLSYGYGFGLYGKVDPLAAFALAVALFTGQLLISHLWLQRHGSGPMEWLWRRCCGSAAVEVYCR